MAVRSHMKCSNCNTQLSCGCQVRTASNGTKVCSSCLNNYENLIKQKIQWKIIPADQNP